MRKTRHEGDCSIYSSLCNGMPEDGICTCGYGAQIMREKGSFREMYSKELKVRRIRKNPMSPEQQEQMIEELERKSLEE